MFNRQSRLPIDEAFQEVEVGVDIPNKTHKQFVNDWNQAMREAVRLARLAGQQDTIRSIITRRPRRWS